MNSNIEKTAQAITMKQRTSYINYKIKCICSVAFKQEATESQPYYGQKINNSVFILFIFN